MPTGDAAPAPASPASADYRPPRLLLQWHLSDRCNLRCTHCYQDEHGGKDERGLADWRRLLDDYLAFLDPGAPGTVPIAGHINVTGGEPFALRDFPALLESFARCRERFRHGILSNGTLIDADMARYLKRWGTAYVQVSIDGTPQTHDRIRGQGSHARAIDGIEALLGAGVRTVISFTAQRSNYREFAEVARLGRELGVARVWSDRMIPCGQGEAAEMLSPEETRGFFALMAQARAETTKRKSGTEIAMHRALQFLVGGDTPYHCTAGDTLITVMPNGDLYPCRRLPLGVGNVYATPLAELYGCRLFRELRDPARRYAGCGNCIYAGHCRGGLRCLAHAVQGSIAVADPGCWLAER